MRQALRKPEAQISGSAQDENLELYVMVSENTAPGRANDKIYKIVPAN